MRAEGGIRMCLGCGLVVIGLWIEGVVIVMVDCGFDGWSTEKSAVDPKIGFIS